MKRRDRSETRAYTPLDEASHHEHHTTATTMYRKYWRRLTPCLYQVSPHGRCSSWKALSIVTVLPSIAMVDTAQIRDALDQLVRLLKTLSGDVQHAFREAIDHTQQGGELALCLRSSDKSVSIPRLVEASGRGLGGLSACTAASPSADTPQESGPAF